MVVVTHHAKRSYKISLEKKIDVLCVKGSGWNLGTIEAAGLPAVKLQPLLELRQLSKLSDEDMVNLQRANLLDSSSPNPSVETLLHAFLPYKFIDHTHSTPFLALANLPDPRAALQEIFGAAFAMVPYVMPGFELAKMAGKVHDETPEIEGLLLAKHGHFTWGDTAKESYDRVIDHTNRVEEWLSQYRANRSVQVKKPQAQELQDFLLKLRGALVDCSGTSESPVIFNIIQNEDTLQFLCRDDVSLHANAGVATPDHVIRIKAHPLLLEFDDMKNSRQDLIELIISYAADYKNYFLRNAASNVAPKTMLSPLPKLIWAKGIGLELVWVQPQKKPVLLQILRNRISRLWLMPQMQAGFTPCKNRIYSI